MSPIVAYRAVGLAAGLVVFSLVAQQLVTLLLVLTVTIILSLPLSAAASRAERKGLPRTLGALAALVAAFATLTALGFLVIPQFAAQVKQFGDRLPTIVAGAARYVHLLTGTQTRNLSNQLSHLVQGYADHPLRLLGPIEQIGLGLAGVIAAAVFVVLAALLIAINPAPLVEGALRLVPADHRAQAMDVVARVRTAWLGWLIAIGIDMIVLGGLLFVGMELVGLTFALGFAVFSAFMTVIPNYGSIISAIPPILVGLSSSPGKAALVLVVYLIVNQIEGNLILPLIMARTVDLHPAVVTIGLLVMAALFGLIGVVIAVPLLSVAIILVQSLWIEPNEHVVPLAGGPAA